MFSFNSINVLEKCPFNLFNYLLIFRQLLNGIKLDYRYSKTFAEKFRNRESFFF